MRNFLTTVKRFCTTHPDRSYFFLSTIISVATIIYFILQGNQNLGDYDAVARLNISRKILDSLTPGVGQLGGIWLPLPQLLFLPFIWNDYLWHSGIAGAIVSGSAFILGAVFLQKTAYLLTRSRRAAFLVWLLFVGNINIVFLQTMALSEMFFLSMLIMVLYFLTKWMQTQRLIDLLGTGLFLTLITLSRYEGYFVFIGATLVVLIECIRRYRRESLHKVEGMMLLFWTAAGFGILFWCIYCFLFYNDFLYWLHLYADGKQQVSTASQAVTGSSANNVLVVQSTPLHSLQVYSQVILAMNGSIVSGLAVLGLFTMIAMNIKKWRTKVLTNTWPVLIISIVLFGFLVYGYQRGFIPEIDFPPKLIPLDARKSFTLYTDSNIRYGIILAPCLALLAGFLASKKRLLYFGVITAFAVQLVLNVSHPRMVQYALPDLWKYSTVSQIPWFQAHYDEGRILISSNAHEDFMFQTGLPYKDFIYEGSREYWMQSLDNPARYADWVIYDDKIQGDMINYFLTSHGHTILQKQFKLVYDVNGFKVYHKK